MTFSFGDGVFWILFKKSTQKTPSPKENFPATIVPKGEKKKKEAILMKVIVAAAGTAGHINPALSIANKIKQEQKDSEIIFIRNNKRSRK